MKPTGKQVNSIPKAAVKVNVGFTVDEAIQKALFEKSLELSATSGKRVSVSSVAERILRKALIKEV
jgi:hypothetical protein